MGDAKYSMEYTLGRCNTKEEIAGLISRNAERGLKPTGEALWLNNQWVISFTSSTTQLRNRKPFQITRGWHTENMLYSLAKVGIGQSQKKPKSKPLVSPKAK